MIRLLGKTIYKLFASLLLIFSAAAAFYMIFYNVAISYGIVISLLTWDTDFHKEFFEYRFLFWILIFGIVPVIVLFSTPMDTLKNQKKVLFSPYFLLSMIGSLLLSIGFFKILDHVQPESMKQKNEYIPSLSGCTAHSYLPTNWLAALGLVIYQKIHSYENKKLFNPAKAFSYSIPDLSGVSIIFIIGESTRSDHMSLFGYSRNTTPHLKQEQNLFAFRGESCDTATKLSLRCMFVRPSGVKDDEARTISESNVFSVLHDLGISIELFAMQSEVWFYQSVQASDYKIQKMLISENRLHKRIDDMLLLDQVKQSIKTHSAGKHLIILHTKGSHYLYSERYPRTFSHFTPECKSIDSHCSLEGIINAYDNSILYMDHVLWKLFELLRNKKAIVFYVVDHGESLAENAHFHGSSRYTAPAEQFRVPYLIWFSDKLIQSHLRYKTMVTHLQKLVKKNPIINHQTIFDSTLGCIGIHSKQLKALNPLLNICDRRFQKVPEKYTHGPLYT